jgi:hypothetical protein
MAMITNEKESSALGKIELHPDQTISMTRKMMQRNPLTEVHRSVVDSLPV